MLKVALDVDGVLRDLDSEVKTFLTNKGYLKKNAYINESEWYFNKRYPSVNLDINDLIYKKCPQIFFYAKPYPFAVDFVKNLYNLHKVKIIIITSQPYYQSWQYTIKWLYKYEIIYFADSLHRVYDSSEKQFIEFDIILDDKAKTIQECLERGKKAVLMKRSWNEHFDLPKIEGFADFLRIVESLMEG